MSVPDENLLINLANQYKIGEEISPSEHIKILKNLERLDSEQLCLVLNYFLTLEKNMQVLIYMVKTVSKCQNDLTVEILSNMLISYLEDSSDDAMKLKCEIANALGRSQNSACVMSLLYVLNNKNENYKLRLACAEALGRIGNSYAVTSLIDLVSDDEEKSIYLRESAAKALGLLGDIRAIEPLANILESKNGLFSKFTFLKERIVETLGRLGQYGDDKSIKALKCALEDESPCIRRTSIEALAEIDDDRVVPLIENMLDDKDEDVARTAAYCLYELLGKEYAMSLLKSDKIQTCCKDEINEIINDDTEANKYEQ